MSETELARTTEATGELTIPQLASNMQKLRDVMKSVMVVDSDYGVVPGTKSKPTLLKPGGEKLAMMFRLAPEFHEDVTQLPNGHREYQVKCRLIHIPTGHFAGEASAVCSTMEAKYRYRGGAFACPECGQTAIIKGKAEYGGGWVCFKKKGGCGAKFPDDQFDAKDLGKVENPDIADTYNTVKQIAQKRAFISAIKTATASSELFTQDVEDGIVPGHEVEHVTEGQLADPNNMPPERVDRRPHKPKARDESREWLQLREALVKVGCRPGHPEEAEAVIKALVGTATLKGCGNDPDMAKDVLDMLDAQLTMNMVKPADLLHEAFVAAGLRQPEKQTA